MSVEQISRYITAEDPQLVQLTKKAISGNTQLLQNMVKAISNLLNNRACHPQTYHQINQLCLSAQPNIIEQINEVIFPKVASVHSNKELDKYIIFWKRLFPGNGSKIEYPSANKTFEGVRMSGSSKSLPSEFDSYNSQFEKNMEMIQQKKVQFFQDFNDSFVTESMDEEMISDIIEMDVQEIIQIREIVESGPIDQLTAEEYLKKIQNFLILKPKTLSKELSEEFNQQRIWAKEFIENYREFTNGGSCYLYKYFNNSISQNKKPNNNNSNTQQIQQSHDFNLGSNFQPQKISIKMSRVELPASEQYYVNEQQNHKLKQKRNFGQKRITENLNANENRNYRPSLKTQNSEKDVTKRGSHQENNHRLELNKQTIDVNYRRTAPNYVRRETQSISDRGQRVAFGSQTHQSVYPQQNNKYDRQYNQQFNKNNQPMRESSRIFQKKRESPYNDSQNKIDDDLNELGIIKHGKKNEAQFILGEQEQMRDNPEYGQRKSYPNQNYFDPRMMKTPENNKPIYANQSLYTGTAFVNRGQGFSTASKKLSDFKREKQQRKMHAPLDHMSPIQGYILKPYSHHFNQLADFTRFRRNCFQDNFTVYASQSLLANCLIKHQNDKITLQIIYTNQSQFPLAVETIYRIPKCFKIEKKTQIKKKFILHEQLAHIFSLSMVFFPLESCLLNLKYSFQKNYHQLSHQYPTVIPLSVTIRNFLEFLMITEEEWKRSWIKLSGDAKNFKTSRHIILDKNVLSDDELESGLKEFMRLNSIQGYSADEFGALCRHLSFHRIVFLVRISLRVDNILTLEIVTDRKIIEQDEIQFLDYCLSIWSMLLCRIEDSSIL